MVRLCLCSSLSTISDVDSRKGTTWDFPVLIGETPSIRFYLDPLPNNPNLQESKYPVPNQQVVILSPVANSHYQVQTWGLRGEGLGAPNQESRSEDPSRIKVLAPIRFL